MRACYHKALATTLAMTMSASHPSSGTTEHNIVCHSALACLNIYPKHCNTNQQGASLLEMMIACAVGAVLLLGLIQIYVATYKTFKLQQAILEVQENARFASHFLTQNIRMAGYVGCEQTPPVDKDTAIIGYGAVLPAGLQGKVLKNTDSVVITQCKLRNGKMTVGKFAYFIGSTTRKNASGNTIHALFTAPLGEDKEELVANVDDMRIRYGLASPDGHDIAQYVAANAVTDWTQVRSVAISLLLSSSSPVLTKAESTTFAGTTLPKDRYLHREWDVYIALRELSSQQ